MKKLLDRIDEQLNPSMDDEVCCEQFRLILLVLSILYKKWNSLFNYYFSLLAFERYSRLSHNAQSIALRFRTHRLLSRLFSGQSVPLVAYVKK